MVWQSIVDGGGVEEVSWQSIVNDKAQSQPPVSILASARTPPPDPPLPSLYRPKVLRALCPRL